MVTEPGPGKAESAFYVVQAVAAIWTFVLLAPVLAGLLGLLSETTAYGLVELAALSLVIPGFVVLVAVAVLSVVNLVKGPNRVRFRLVLWYVVGPCLLVGSTLLDPEQMNAFSPVYDTLVFVSLVVSSVLPILWLQRRNT